MSTLGSAAEARSCDLYLAVISEQLSCDELTRLIKAPPDVGWSKGDSYVLQGAKKVYKFSRWALLERASGADGDWEEAINRLLGRANSVKEEIANLPEEVVVKFQINLTEDNGVFGFSLLSEHIAFMSSIRASLDMSVVVQQL